MKTRALVLVLGLLSNFVPFNAAQAVTVRDRFNDESINQALWRKVRVGGVNVKESGNRLRVTANGLTGSQSYSFLEVRPWGANWQQNFSLKADYRLAVPTLPSNRVAAIGFGLSFQGSPHSSGFTGLTAGVQRQGPSLVLVWAIYDQGVVVSQDYRFISQMEGQLRITWSRTFDRLRIEAGGSVMDIHGLYADLGSTFGQTPVVISMGGVTFNGSVQFTAAQAWLDNFEFVGAVRPR